MALYKTGLVRVIITYSDVSVKRFLHDTFVYVPFIKNLLEVSIGYYRILSIIDLVFNIKFIRRVDRKDLT